MWIEQSTAWPDQYPPPAEEALIHFYEQRGGTLRRPETVRVGHIFAGAHRRDPVSESEACTQIGRALKALRKGGSFEDVADRYSDCGGNGGDLGPFPRGVMVPSFDAVAFGLGTGAVSGVFRTEFGFHIVELRERRAAYMPEFEEVRGEISDGLTNMARQASLRRAVDELRRSARIEGFEPYRAAAHEGEI